MAFTKVSPAGIGSTPGDGYRIGDSFLHSTGVEITNINATGILTAASLDISGDIDFDGHTNLDNVSVAGVSTFSGIVAAGVGSTAITLDNNHKMTFGSAHELEMFHDGSNSYIKNRFHGYPARLKIISENNGIDIMSGSGGNAHGGYENAISCEINGATKIYHAGVGPYFETYGAGVIFQGSIQVGQDIIHHTDTDTKIRFPLHNTISFETTGNERLRISQSGNVGIGTDTPLQRLHVKQGSTTTPAMVEALGAKSHVKFQHNAGSSYTTTIGSKTLGAGNVGLTFDTGTSGGGTKMTIDVNGKVGIGTELPQTMHHLYGSSGLYTRFESAQGQVNFGNSNGAGVIHVTSTSQPLRFLVNGSNERARIASDGKFGIGDFSSGSVAQALHVKGSEPKIYLEHTGGYDMTLTTSDGMGQNGISVSGGALSLAYDNKNIWMCRNGGYVGINQTNPQALLDVGGNVDGNVQASFTRANDPNFRIQFRNESSSNNVGASQGKFGLFYASNSADICGMQFHRGSSTGAGTLSFTTGGTERLSIDSTGLLHGASDAQGNTTLGGNAGNSFSGTSALQNTLIGYDAGTAITSGDNNVALGSNALKSLTTNGTCTAIGNYALEDNTANSNTAVGYNSMKENVSGQHNTALGFDTLVNNTGNLNVAIGYDAMKASNHNAGHDNVMIGAYAATNALHMYRNVIIGRSAIDQSTSNNSIHNNVIIGYEAGRRLNYYIGHNVILGAHAMDGGGTGGGLANQYNISDNIAIGRYALQNVKHTSNNNIVLGQEAAQNAATGSGTYSNWTHNIAIGYRCMRDATGGSDAMVAVGSNALEFHTGDGDASSGGYTVAFGGSALRNNRHIRHSVAVGNQAGAEWNAVKGAMHEGGCTFIGGSAGRTCSTATSAIAIGRDAMAGSGPATGSHNTAIGSRALERITSGTNNCAVGGLYTGLMLTTGDYNNFFGSLAGYAYNVNTGATGDHNNIFGGYSAASGNNDHENIFGGGLTGKGANTTFIRGPVYNSPNTSSFSTTSDERIKKNIVDNNIGLDAIEKIRVRNFEYRTKDEITDFDYADAVVVEKEGVQLGVIAQEIKEILPDVVKQNTTGAYAVDPDNITWYLVNAVKELSAEVKSLKAQLNS